MPFFGKGIYWGFGKIVADIDRRAGQSEGFGEGFADIFGGLFVSAFSFDELADRGAQEAAHVANFGLEFRIAFLDAVPEIGTEGFEAGVDGKVAVVESFIGW